MSERACGNCGDPEFRIDGYCSIYCRDVHGERMEREEVEAERDRLRAAIETHIEQTGFREEHAPLAAALSNPTATTEEEA